METKTYIIGDSADKDNILDLCSQLSNKGVEADAIFLTEDTTASEEVCSVPVALLWISSKAGTQLFNIAQERNKRNLTTLNFFAEPVALNDSERRAVGRNQSVFAEVNPNEFVEDLIELIGQIKPSSTIRTSENLRPQKTAIEVTRLKTSGNASTVKGALPHPIADTQVESEEEQEENQTTNNKRALWMPWVWYLCSFLYYVCISEGIINGWTNQTFWFLLLTTVFFIFAYKIVRSTLNAIKTNKWCYLYIPISLIMLYPNLLNGFKLLATFIKEL